MVLQQGSIGSGGDRIRSVREALSLSQGRRGTGKMREKVTVRNVFLIRDIYDPGDDLPYYMIVSILVEALACKVIL